MKTFTRKKGVPAMVDQTEDAFFATSTPTVMLM